MKGEIAAVCAALMFLGSGSLHAQSVTGGGAPTQTSAPADTVAAFLRTVASAAERYVNREVAMREGYRRVGPDFPGMGEHWVQPGRLVSGRFDAGAPPILTYATIGDRVVLTGVAFAVPLAVGAAPPAFPSPAHWHDHAATVDEESLLIAPAGSRHGHAAHGPDTLPRPRLAMLHVWSLTNPDGVFAQENWALPYARLGLAPPDSVDASASRALSFMSGGDAYYRELFRAAVRLRPDEAAVLDSLAESLRSQVDEWVARQHAGWSAEPSSTAHLTHLWVAWWQSVEQSVSEPVWQRLAPFGPSHH